MASSNNNNPSLEEEEEEKAQPRINNHENDDNGNDPGQLLFFVNGKQVNPNDGTIIPTGSESTNNNSNNENVPPNSNVSQITNRNHAGPPAFHNRNINRSRRLLLGGPAAAPNHDQAGPSVIKRRRLGMTRVELWLHAVQRCELDPSYRQLVPSGLEEYHALCMNPEALETAKKKLFDFLWGTRLGKFRDEVQPVVLHLFFMLLHFLMVFIQETHLHFCAADMRQLGLLINLIQFPPQLERLNQQWDYFAGVMPANNNVAETRAIRPIWRQTIRSLVEHFANLYSKDKTSVPAGFDSNYLLAMIDAQAVAAPYFSRQKMEQIQQLQTSSHVPWGPKYDYLGWVWMDAVEKFLESKKSNNETNDSSKQQQQQQQQQPHQGPWDLTAMGVPATVQDMERLLQLPCFDELKARAKYFFFGILAKLPDRPLAAGIAKNHHAKFVMTTDDYVAFLRFFFHFNHDKFEVFRNTRKYLPTHGLVNGAQVKHSIANYCLCGHLPKDSLVHRIDAKAFLDTRLMPFRYSSLLDLYKGILPDQFAAPEDGGRVATAIADLEALVLPLDERAQDGESTAPNHDAAGDNATTNHDA